MKSSPALSAWCVLPACLALPRPPDPRFHASMAVPALSRVSTRRRQLGGKRAARPLRSPATLPPLTSASMGAAKLPCSRDRHAYYMIDA